VAVVGRAKAMCGKVLWETKGGVDNQNETEIVK